jgi:hypothetical protein
MALRKRLIDGDYILNPTKTVELTNLMPFDVMVILFEGEYGQGRFKPLARLGKLQSKVVPFPGTSYDTKISCVREGEAALLTMPIYFGRNTSPRDTQNLKYFFGAVSWNSTGMDTDTYNLYADVIGIRVYNHFPFAVQVQYKNQTFNIGANSWRGYIGGSPGVIYFTNQGQGIDVGDTFDVTIQGYGVVTQFMVPNKFAKNIHIGATSTP